MDWSPVDPSSLMGNDLTRWYLRSPDEIEQQRQAAQAQRYEEFFGRIAPARPPAALPGLTDQDADVATDDGANRGATSWQRPDQSPDGPWAETQAQPIRLAAAQQTTAPGNVGCLLCHGPVPPVLPFPFPFLPGGPFFRDTPSIPSGGGSPKRRFPQCDVQYDNDTEICAGLPTPAARGKCWPSANERQAYCRNHDGEVGWPLLQTR